ncbi:helix-turn-helix domain-containing protein [Chryseobacterium angstadtii]|nr:ATP-binding protein [Chryseobacterium angstadtii]
MNFVSLNIYMKAMTHSLSIFGKNIFDLNYQDLELFFQTEQEEKLNLEFKSYVNQGPYKEKENLIKKSVCALLNSEGGIIIWGAPIETKDTNGNTKASGNLTPFDSGLDKDKLINTLSDSIIPMPIGIKVNFLNDGNGKFVIIIEVEKSVERPHQYDNRYYVRLDGQTRVAPHYLIKALIKSQDFPVIRGHIKLKNIQISGNDIFLTFRYLLFNTSQFNNEKNAFIRIVVHPGDIYINQALMSNPYDKDFPLISHGRPIMSSFIIKLNTSQIQNKIDIIFQFGGEKSPSKVSTYKYDIMKNFVSGDVKDENIYLIEKRENSLPSDVSSNTDDDNINQLLDL